MRIGAVLDMLSCRHLTREEARAAFTHLMSGAWCEVEIAAFISALKARGESPEEIAGAALALRETAVEFPRPSYPFADTCRHRRRQRGQLQHLHRRGSSQRGARHSGREARESLGLVPLRIGRRTRGRGRPARCPTRRRAPFPRRNRDLLSLCARLSCRRAPCFAGAENPRDPDHFQPAWTARESEPPAAAAHGSLRPGTLRAARDPLGMLGADVALVVHGSGLDEVALHGPTTAALWRDGTVTELDLPRKTRDSPAVRSTGSKVAHRKRTSTCSVVCSRGAPVPRTAMRWRSTREPSPGSPVATRRSPGAWPAPGKPWREAERPGVSRAGWSFPMVLDRIVARTRKTSLGGCGSGPSLPCCAMHRPAPDPLPPRSSAAAPDSSSSASMRRLPRVSSASHIIPLRSPTRTRRTPT